jgi:transmembrane 9 superfamily member 2/4
MMLAVLVGNGAQLCSMAAVTLGWAFLLQLQMISHITLPLVFALLGFLSPSNRGSLATVMMVCWSIFGRFVSLHHLLLFIFPDMTLH